MSPLSKIILEDAERILSRVDMSPLKNKCVTVTGATGIIGTYILAALHLYGKCKVVHPVATKMPEEGHPALDWFKDPWGWTKINLAHPEDQAVIPMADYMLYGAGYGQPAKFMSKPLDTIRINTVGLLSALGSMLPGGRVLYVSSSEIYSGNPTYPYAETTYGGTTPQHPRACYIEAKRCGEAICSSFNRGNRHNATAVAARVSLAFGPGTRKGDDRVINQFICQALTQGEIRLRDAGTAIRTYCYIADSVEQLFNVWLHGKEEVYNVGGYARVTILELAEIIGRYCEVPVWSPLPMVVADTSAPKVVDMNLNRIEQEFDKHSNLMQLEDGVIRTIEWQKKLYEV